MACANVGLPFTILPRVCPFRSANIRLDSCNCISRLLVDFGRSDYVPRRLTEFAFYIFFFFFFNSSEINKQHRIIE